MLLQSSCVSYLPLTRSLIWSLTRLLTRSITPLSFLHLPYVFIPLHFYRFRIKSLMQFLTLQKLTFSLTSLLVLMRLTIYNITLSSHSRLLSYTSANLPKMPSLKTLRISSPFLVPLLQPKRTIGGYLVFSVYILKRRGVTYRVLCLL